MRSDRVATTSIYVGGILGIIGIAGIIMGFFPPVGDGLLAVTGGIVFGSGIIAKAITENRSK